VHTVQKITKKKITNVLISGIPAAWQEVMAPN
jgi:hypothetical protein